MPFSVLGFVVVVVVVVCICFQNIHVDHVSVGYSRCGMQDYGTDFVNDLISSFPPPPKEFLCFIFKNS